MSTLHPKDWTFEDLLAHLDAEHWQYPESCPTCYSTLGENYNQCPDCAQADMNKRRTT
jgi:hypothetical protein